ncbi:alpha/beta fold hydrolase [Shewanella sp. A3A]|nr:alpha/beta fold hydrolase [Shewanella ferrihydritica]
MNGWIKYITMNKTYFLAPLALCAALLLPTMTFAEASPPTTLGVESYGSLPFLSQFDLSPDGQRLAYVQNQHGQLTLVVYDLNTKQSEYVVQSDNLKVFFNGFEWANDHTLLVGVRDVRGEWGVSYNITRLMTYDVTGKRKLELTVKQRDGERVAQFQDNIISLLPEEPDYILMAIDYELVGQPGVYKVNIYNNSRIQVQRNTPYVIDWIADRQGHVRIAVGREETTYFYDLMKEDGSRERLFEFDVFSPESVTIKGFAKDPNIIYLTALHDGKDALYKMDLTTRQRQLVHADKDYDVAGSLLYSDQTGDVAGFVTANAQDSRIYWDSNYQQLQQALAKAIPHAYNVVMDMSKDGNKYLLYSESNEDSGSFFIGDRQAGQLVYIGSEYPDVTPEKMHNKQLVKFKARDGLELEGYLTLPADYQADAATPTVVLPHGGPMSRDYDGFDYWSQYLAEQGYIVFQPNFRGSAGYGYDFAMKAIQKWGQEMQDDLQDAAHYLIDNHYTDGKHTCIVGASYGGYAALMGVAKYPKDFQCAASFGGVTDLTYLVSQARFFTNVDVVRKQFGRDAEKLDAASPVSYAKQIERPVLLIHGSDDNVVSVKHSLYMDRALESADKKVQFIELEYGDHHLSNQDHRLKTLAAIKDFLDKNLR